MSINLHISADSAKDFFQHLTELSAGFYVPAGTIGSAVLKDAAETTISVSGGGTGATPTTEEPAASPEPKAARKPRAAKTETPATSATEQDGSATESSTSSATAPSEKQNEAPSTATSDQTASNEDEGREGPYPDFDTEVTPVVLGAVRAKGKEWVAALLGEFGVEKASQLKDAQFQELIDTINERMGA